MNLTGAIELGKTGDTPKLKKPKGWYSKAAKAERAEIRARKREERDLLRRIREARTGRITAAREAMVRRADHVIPRLQPVAVEEREPRGDATIRRQNRHRIRERELAGRLSATPERTGPAPFEIIKLAEPDPETGRKSDQEVQVLSDWPLERLYRTGAFRGRSGDRKTDAHIAYLRNEAGKQLYAHWYYGRLFPLGSRDYRQPYTGASDAFAIAPQSERQAYHRSRWRQADVALGSDRVARVTRAIVLDEKEPVAVGKVITGRQQEQQARAVAIEYLIDGLDRLRQHWDMRG